MTIKTDDLRIDEIREVIAPADLIANLPVSNTAANTVLPHPQDHSKYHAG